MRPKDTQIERKESVIFLAQDGSLAGSNGAIHPVDALVCIIAVAHVHVNAGHVIQQSEQQDKDFLEIGRFGPRTFQDHVSFSVKFEREFQVFRASRTNGLALIGQAQIVQENSGKAGLALLRGDINVTIFVFLERGKVKGTIVNHEQRNVRIVFGFVVFARRRGVIRSSGFHFDAFGNSDAANRDKAGFVRRRSRGSSSSSGCCRSDNGRSSGAPSLFGRFTAAVSLGRRSRRGSSE